MAQLFDLSGAPDDALNYHLDCLCKAAAEPGDDGIWEPHPSVFLRALVEAFTQLGLTASSALKDEAIAWLSGAMHAAEAAHHPLAGGVGPVENGPTGATGGPTGGFPGGAGGMAAPGGSFPVALSLNWTPGELQAVRAYLLSKPLAAFSVDDFLLLADYLVHSHMPADLQAAQAEALATRAGLMGKLEADHPEATPAQVGNVLAAMPNTLAGAQTLVALAPAHLAAMEYGRARAGENIQKITADLRHRIKSVVLQALEVGFAREAGALSGPGQALQQRLFDAFAEFNRDWRRVAVTEAGEIKNQGFVANQKPGAFVKRVERYRGACSFCRKLDGRIFKVVAADDPDKDGTKEVWPGKTNVGRSASPNKRVDGELVARLPSELWWAAAGVQHPHCRGVWVAVEAPLPTSSDKQWKAWLSALGLPEPAV